MDDVVLVQARSRPDLAREVLALDELWPEFVLHDPAGELYSAHARRWIDWSFVLIQESDPGTLLGRALTIPFTWHEPLEALPDRGWDAAIEIALLSDEPNMACGVEVTLSEAARGRHLGGRATELICDIMRERGLSHFVAPVRPSGKADHPEMSMDDYLGRRDPDGEVSDPWIRQHLRQGAELIKVAPLAMTIPGTFDDWQRWTSIDFNGVGATVSVEGGLAPVMVNHTERTAVYVEPNVWMAYDLQRR